jgi:hypothetical protein
MNGIHGSIINQFCNHRFEHKFDHFEDVTLTMTFSPPVLGWILQKQNLRQEFMCMVVY